MDDENSQNIGYDANEDGDRSSNSSTNTKKINKKNLRSKRRPTGIVSPKDLESDEDSQQENSNQNTDTESISAPEDVDEPFNMQMLVEKIYSYQNAIEEWKNECDKLEIEINRLRSENNNLIDENNRLNDENTILKSKLGIEK